METRIEKYEAYLENQELAKGTIDAYIRYAKQIEQHLEEKGATKQTVLEYKQGLRKQKVAASTFNLALISVNKYLKFAGYEDCTVKTEKVQKRRSLENVISIGEYKKMLEIAKSGKQSRIVAMSFCEPRS